MKTPLIFLLLTSLVWSACDKLPAFDKKIVGEWDSVSYYSDSTDLSLTHQAHLSFNKIYSFTFTYPEMETSSGYVLQYDVYGDWSAKESDQSILLENYNNSWTQLTATFVSERTISLKGTYKGNQIFCVFNRQ